MKVRLEVLQFLYALTDTAGSEPTHDPISRPITTSSASSFDIPSFSLLSVHNTTTNGKENGFTPNSSHVKSSQSLHKLLHSTQVDDRSPTLPGPLHSTMNTQSNDGESGALAVKRDNEESRYLRELLFGMQGIETPRFSASDTSIDRCTRTLINRFLECGWLYEKIRKLINTPSNSLVAQAFAANLSSELREYHRLISVIEQQVNK